MIIYLKNPNHGTHIAYSESEAAECEKNGWERIDEIPRPAKVEEAPVVEAPVKRRGRPRKAK